MTIVLIIAAAVVLLFLFFCKRRNREAETETRYYTREALQSAHNANTRREAAEADYQFYCNRINDLNIMLAEAIAAEGSARDKLSKIETLNQSGAVISDKASEKARRELYQLQRRRLSLENQLHAAERGKLKAYSTLTE